MTNRPFRVTLSLWLVLLFTIWNILRVWTAIEWRAVLLEFGVLLGPVYLVISGALWFVVGVALIIGILRIITWARFVLLWRAAGYTIWYWIDRLVWQEPRPNWPFVLILNLVLLVFVIFASNSLARNSYER
jgi:hypothetical protein